VLLDEVGRGTATFDGMSIAWALAEYMHDHARSKTLFATHYHELNDLTELYPRIHPFKVDVQEVGNGIIFTRRVLPGSSDHSFGIHVARMAGLPRSVTERAEQILRTLESNNLELLAHAADGASERTPAAAKPRVTADVAPHSGREDQISMFEIRDDRLRARLAEVDVNRLTPMQALQILSELKDEAGRS
ncbi:MAG: MutS-related protein, partial [Candidatus Kapaibacterium sp.]